MAVAGSMTTAYRYRLVNGEPVPERTTFPTQQCQHPADAVAALKAGAKYVTVRGSDASVFLELFYGV
jgi:hypothetical protein